MATEGIKIIDSDTASDIYWGIVDFYDSGGDIGSIDNLFPIIQEGAADDLDNEIYVTACALAHWEIGLMTEDKLAYVKSILDKNTSINEWTEVGKKHGKARQKELEKFWQKISQLNLKPRQRKKYRRVTAFYFEVNDVLTFQFESGNYGVAICYRIDQYRGACDYMLCPAAYDFARKPQEQDIKHLEMFVTNQGLDVTGISHSTMATIKEKFEKIGQAVIAEKNKELGSLSYGFSDNSKLFAHTFNDLDYKISNFLLKKKPLKVLCEE